MQHRGRDPESSWSDRDASDRYALCALTGTAFSIICEFRANFELRAARSVPVCSFSALRRSPYPVIFFLFFPLPLPPRPSRSARLSRSVALSGFRHIRRYKSARDVSRVAVRLVPFVRSRSCRRDCTRCTTATIRTLDDAHRPDKKRLTGAVLASVRQSTSTDFLALSL